MTPDGRYFVVRGRLWRMSDPTLDAGERQSFVDQLMEARRAIDPPLALPEMGWTLAPAVHGRGYAREALDAILGWAAGRGIARTTCIIDPDNAPSLRLAARLGYATVRDAAYKGRTVRVLERQAPA